MTETTFEALGLDAEMLGAVASKGFEAPTPIQRLTIPALLLADHDLIAQAQTGTGKTAAFGLPLLQLIAPDQGHVRALVLVPTRELALQVTEELQSLNRTKHRSIATIYGGASMSEQLRRLERGVDIVVGTPGRVLDHLRRGTLDLSYIRYIVLDEADEMLDMGFIEDIETILGHAPAERRTLLFSATMPERIVRLAQRSMHETEVLRAGSEQMTTDLANQIYFEVRESDKFDALTRIIDVEPEFYGIVFSRTKIAVDEIVSRLVERGYAAEGLHGDVGQAQREKILRRFRQRQANVLVATDVAARGIDIEGLSHVINYSLPQDTESYVHRIGRTGRAGNEGTAITFITRPEMRRFGIMQREVKADIQRRTLPSPQDIVSTRRARIEEELREVVADESYRPYTAMATEILGAYPAEAALAALLKMAYHNELDETRYPEIRSFSVDRRGTARLFLHLGRRDGYDARRLVDLLKQQCELDDRSIDDAYVGDTFAFVSVPFAEAERVVRRLNSMGEGNGRIANIATDNDRPDPAARRKRAPEGGVHPRPKRSPGSQRPEYARPEHFRPERDKPQRDRTGEGNSTEGKASETKAPEGKTSEGTFDWSAFAEGGNRWENRAPKPARTLRERKPKR